MEHARFANQGAYDRATTCGRIHARQKEVVKTRESGKEEIKKK